MILGSANSITDTSYDLNTGYSITERDWYVLDTNYNVVQNCGTIQPNFNSLASGNYIFEEVVKDNAGLTSLPCYQNLNVKDDYSVSGKVNHTDLWNQHRIAFNQVSTGTDDNPRTYDIFFPGEEFDLIANTSAVALNVHVYIKEYPSFATDLIEQNTNVWGGVIWDTSMINWKTQPLTFVFTATFPNSITKTVEVPVQIVYDEFWKQHRAF
jgi:hypothetical protein